MLVFQLLALIYVSFANNYANSGSVLKWANKSDDHNVKLKGYGREMEGKIVGGKPVDLERIPYSVQIFNQGAMCAGTILNSWTLLTAAHCFDLNKDINDLMVQIGSRYVYDFNANQYYVSDIVLHEKYNQTGLFACDIALVFMERPIDFGPTAKKAILVNTDAWMDPKENSFIVSGWGLTEYGGKVSKEGLMMAQLEFVSKQKCDQLHKTTMSTDMFCLYGHGSKDTCKGDSGGGVYWNDMLVGIVSHGDGCAKKLKPSVYANVYFFRDWIKREMLSYMNIHCYSKNSKLSPSQEAEYEKSV